MNEFLNAAMLFGFVFCFFFSLLTAASKVACLPSGRR